MKTLCFLSTLILFISCTPKPAIEISNDLKVSLGTRYSDYVEKLNASADGDTSALNEFIRYNHIYNAAGYDHGWVLIELMKIVGDETFSNVLKQLNRDELRNVNSYMLGGLDVSYQNNTIVSRHPESFKILGIE